MSKLVLFAFVLAALLLGLLFQGLSDQSEVEGLEIIAQDLDTVWAMDFLPDGRLVFTERPGRVNIAEEGVVRNIANISVSEVSESGLHGIAVDPDFGSNRFIYVYYTHANGNRVSRFTLGNSLENEFVLLDNIPNAPFHDGGRVKFGHDGMLYVTTGDATVPSSAQDTMSLAGKILRMNKNGSVPDDNPFGNYVYSYGHRNPQGIAWTPSGVIYASEHGPTRNDEVNTIEKGSNYGWPEVQCDQLSEQYNNPIRCFSEFTLAPSGIAYHDGILYAAGLRGTQVRKLVLAEGGASILREEELFSNLGRIRDVIVHGGYLYIATSNNDGRGLPRAGDDKILRIKI